MSTTGILQFTKPSYLIKEDGIYVGDPVAVSRTGGTDGIASVKVTSNYGSATVPDDLAKVSVTLTWQAGEGGIKLVPISIVKDLISEGHESMTLKLTSKKGAVYAPVKTAQLVITDKEDNLLQTPTDETIIPVISNVYSGIKLKDLKSFFNNSNPNPNPNPKPNPDPDITTPNLVLFINTLANVNEKAIQIPANTITMANILGFDCLKVLDTSLLINLTNYLNNYASVTMEAWFYNEASGATVFRGTKTNAENYFNPGDFSAGGTNTVHSQYVSGSDIPINRWYHAALVLDKEKLRFYIDGKLADMERTVGTITSDKLLLGKISGPSNSYMRNFKLFNEVKYSAQFVPV
ncbi:MAG: LamG-like jellyroll fold domain-containing protein [Flammeovirgaceae bacterium]